MRRGLTMVELLLALSLLTGIMVAIASWTQVTARASTAVAGPLHWRSAARAVLQLIHDDLVSGDFGEPKGRRPNQKARVEVVGDVLRIRTRLVGLRDHAGPVAHEYRFEASSGEVRLGQRSGQGRSSTRLLLDQVHAWQATFDDENRVLTVTITSTGGTTAKRSYILP